MEIDGFKPRGATKASKADAGGAVLRNLPLFGVVKNNIDPIRSGRLQVYISDLGASDPDDSTSWTTVSYMSPFYGVTTPSAADTGWGEYIKNPNSYGMWNSQPDIGTTVICVFINGDPNYGFWIGCVPDPESLQMIPAIGGTDNVVTNEGEAKSLGGATRLPVTNINSNNEGIANTGKFLTDAKPVHSYVASILAQQGLIRDPIRGVIGSSAQRESPSRVGWGVSTPGRPIYEGGFTDDNIADAVTQEKQPSSLKVIARRGGHTLVMDDGDLLGKDQLVRIRSSLGHQILMSDDGQTLFIIHANGQSYIELGKEGTIDMYSTNSFNVRTQGDLNLHADNNININAGKQLNISADTIAINSEKETTQKVGTDFSLYASGNYTTKVDGKMSFASGADASFYSDAVTYFNGSKINLNTGASSLVPQEVKPLTVTAHTDTLNDATKGWAAAPGKLLSIVSRAPAHAPWANANQGVDVKIDNNASAALPSAPSPAVASASAEAGAPPNPVSIAAAATVPPTSAISSALNKNATSNILAATKTIVDNGSAAVVAKLGAGVVETAQGPIPVVGALAQTPSQLEQCGVIKPGSAALVNSLVQGGKTVQQALTPNLFTGKDGVTNLASYVTDPTKQIKSAVDGLSITQQAFTNSGLLNGNESGTAIAGVVMSGFNNGTKNTIDFVKNSTSTALGAITGATGLPTNAVNNLMGNPASLISNGNFAGALSDKITGGLSSISGSLDGLKKASFPGISGLIENAKGVAAGAFSAITGSIPTLKSGIPQNIKDITEKAIASAQSPGGSNNPLSGVTGIVDNAVSSATGLLNAKSIVSTANLSTGLGLLPGGDKITGPIINNALGAINSVPGVAAVTGLIGQANSITNGISSLATANPLASSGALNAVTTLTSGLTKGLADLKSGKLSLASLASAGLPAGAAAQLNAAISSMSSGGAVPIKLPTVALNTTNRSELTAQVTSILGNAKIPAPNFAGNPATTGETAGSTAIKNKLKAQSDLNEKVQAKTTEVRNARLEYSKAKNQLPAGDPQIDELRSKWLALSDELEALNTVA